LDEAGRLAVDPMVRRRLEVVSAAFAVTERFSAFCRATDELSGAALEPEAVVSDARLAKLVGEYRRERTAFLGAYERAVALGGVAQMDLHAYLRNDPEQVAQFRGVAGEPAGFDDKEWDTLSQPGELDDRTFVWSTDPWSGHGEPAEGRTILVGQSGAGQVTLRFERCRAESLTQWIRTVPGGHYRAEVGFRGRVSPGDQVMLVMNCVDAGGRYAGRERTDQVPAGDWGQGGRLEVVIEAPADAAEVGLSVYVMHQMPGDYAEFSGLKVDRW
jgi:hypothetical protein